jgi:hypothetical protein
MTDEQRAGGKFDMAMILAKAGKTDTAKDYCKLIVKTYPGTTGAAQAQAYLKRPVQQERYGEPAGDVGPCLRCGLHVALLHSLPEYIG